MSLYIACVYYPAASWLLFCYSQVFSGSLSLIFELLVLVEVSHRRGTSCPHVFLILRGGLGSSIAVWHHADIGGHPPSLFCQCFRGLGLSVAWHRTDIDWFPCSPPTQRRIARAQWGVELSCRHEFWSPWSITLTSIILTFFFAPSTQRRIKLAQWGCMVRLDLLEVLL